MIAQRAVWCFSQFQSLVGLVGIPAPTATRLSRGYGTPQQPLELRRLLVIGIRTTYPV
jgi:hypothetical protein